MGFHTFKSKGKDNFLMNFQDHLTYFFSSMKFLMSSTASRLQLLHIHFLSARVFSEPHVMNIHRKKYFKSCGVISHCDLVYPTLHCFVYCDPAVTAKTGEHLEYF